jgi:hypothetical protein
MEVDYKMKREKKMTEQVQHKFKTGVLPNGGK